MVKAWFSVNPELRFFARLLTKRSRLLADLKITYLSLNALKPYVGNPRTHSKRQIRQIAESIKSFGWTNPILIDDKAGVIAGHGRLEAAKLLRLEKVPTIRLSDLSEAQKRAYILADNKLAENAGWDEELLAIELQFLTDIDLEFDVTVTGFEMGEIDILLDASSDGEAEPEFVPEPVAGRPVSRLGDLWLLARIAFIAAMRLKPRLIRRCWPAPRRIWFLLTRLTMFRSTAMSAARARPSTMNLRWLRARCLASSSKRSLRAFLIA